MCVIFLIGGQTAGPIGTKLGKRIELILVKSMTGANAVGV